MKMHGRLHGVMEQQHSLDLFMPLAGQLAASPNHLSPTDMALMETSMKHCPPTRRFFARLGMLPPQSDNDKRPLLKLLAFIVTFSSRQRCL